MLIISICKLQAGYYFDDVMEECDFHDSSYNRHEASCLCSDQNVGQYELRVVSLFLWKVYCEKHYF